MKTMPEEKIRKVLKIMKQPISTETPIGDDDAHLGDFIEDSNVEVPMDVANSSGLMGATEDILDTLIPREAKVLCNTLWDRYEYRSHVGASGQTI